MGTDRERRNDNNDECEHKFFYLECVQPREKVVEERWGCRCGALHILGVNFSDEKNLIRYEYIQ